MEAQSYARLAREANEIVQRFLTGCLIDINEAIATFNLGEYLEPRQRLLDVRERLLSAQGNSYYVSYVHLRLGELMLQRGLFSGGRRLV